jgi:putative ABC transport system permease protein
MTARLILAARFALRQLRADALASLLAAAMLAIGAGTITFVLSLGAMAAAEATRSLAALGPNVLSALVSATDGRQPRRFDPTQDPREIARALGVEEVAALGVSFAPVRVGGRTRSAPVLAVTGPAPRLLNLNLSGGRWFDAQDADLRECVVGRRLSEDAPLGGTMLVTDRPCLVVGVLARAPPNALLQLDIDQAIIVSRSAAARLDVDAPVRQFLLRVPTHADEAEVRGMLRRYAAAAWPWADLALRSSGELIAALRAQYERQARLYALVASVAVAAASIGLCAMMLAQVRSRRRELGVRLAVGALPGDIVLQILAEALLIGFLAGLLGNIGALAVLAVIATLSGLPLEFDLAMAVATTAGTVLAGAVSGGVPAVVAARTDPVHSIRT